MFRLRFSQCVDTPKPPFIPSIPQGQLHSLCCSWSCGQGAASPSLLFLSPSPSSFPYCFLACLRPPPQIHPCSCLHPSIPASHPPLKHAASAHVIAEQGVRACASVCMSVRALEPTQLVLHACLQKNRVMSSTATHTPTASQRCPSVHRPPQLCDNSSQEQQLTQTAEDAGITGRRDRSDVETDRCEE